MLSSSLKWPGTFYAAKDKYEHLNLSASASWAHHHVQLTREPRACECQASSLSTELHPVIAFTLKS